MENHPRVAILGVTGFIGRGLAPLLAGRGFRVTGVSRSSGGSLDGVDRWQKTDALDLSGHAAVINLAGAPIDTRWTRKNRQRFRESRVNLTDRIVQSIRQLPESERPRTLINGSAVGLYGDRGDEVLRERAAAGDGFLAALCRDWESAARQAEALGMRVVLLRTGIVLGRGHGALGRMLPIFKLGLGGKLGSGRQWMPWIHIDDQRAAILHALESESLHGPLNLAAPEPERNRDFTRKLAAAVHRPAFLPAPAFALKLALGEFATALLASERAVPAALEADGFPFRFRKLEDALADLV